MKTSFLLLTAHLACFQAFSVTPLSACPSKGTAGPVQEAGPSVEEEWGFSYDVNRQLLDQYLQSLDQLKLTASLGINNGEGSDKDARLGPIKVPNGTVLTITAEFTRR